MKQLVVIQNNQIVVSSKDIADHFGKQHKDVLENIHNILAAENSATKFYQETTYQNRGKDYKEYLMNRDGFSLLAMGFTGKKALQWKLKYIEAFNEMEETLKQGYLEKEEVTAYKHENNIPMHSAVSRLIVFTEPTAYKLTCIMYNNVDPINLEIAKYFNRQPVAPVKSVVPIEEKIGIDYDCVKEYIEEMETNISLIRGMVKHLTEFKRTREEHKYQMKLIREIGFNIFDGTGDLEKVVNSRIQ